MGIKLNFNAQEFKRDLLKQAKTNLEKQVLSAVKRESPEASVVKVVISDDMKKITITGVSQEVANKALSKLR